MANKSKPVEVIGVDTETVEKADIFPKAYAFYIKLSDKPDTLWEKYLREWDNVLYSMRRQISIVGDNLRITLVYGEDDVQKCVSYIEWLVKFINGRVEEHNKKVEIEEKGKMVKGETNAAREDEIRRKLREL